MEEVSKAEYIKYEDGQVNLNNDFLSEYEQTTEGEQQSLISFNDKNQENSSSLQQQAYLKIIQKYRDRTIIKYLFLIGILSSGLMFYNNNFQGILKEYILEDTGINQQTFQLFQTLSTGPIIPLILFSGPLNDIVGIRNGMISYFFIMAIGMWVATVGGYYDSFTYLLIGKVLNNGGIEMGIGARSSLLAKWYSGGDLALYTSIYLTLVKITQLTASLTLTRIYERYDSLFQPILVGAIIGTLCFLINLCAFFTDQKADNQVKKITEYETSKKKVSKFSLKDLKEFSLFYWTIILAFGMNFGVYYPFIGNSTTIYFQKFNLSSKNTGDIQSFNYFIGLFSPLTGLLIKKFKRFQFLILIFGNCCAITFFSILLFHPGCEEACFDQLILPVCLMGIYMMIFPVVLVPSIANASPLKLAGTAYGIGYAFKNFTEAIIPYIAVGPLLEHSTIDATIILFVGLSITCLVIATIIHIWFNKTLKQQKK